MLRQIAILIIAASASHASQIYGVANYDRGVKLDVIAGLMVSFPNVEIWAESRRYSTRGITEESYEFTSEVSDTGYIAGVHWTDDDIHAQNYVDLYLVLPIGPTAFGVMHTYDFQEPWTEGRVTDVTMMRFSYTESWTFGYIQPEIAVMFAYNHKAWRSSVNASLGIAWWWRISLSPMLLWERREDVTRLQSYITLRVTL